MTNSLPPTGGCNTRPYLQDGRAAGVGLALRMLSESDSLSRTVGLVLDQLMLDQWASAIRVLDSECGDLTITIEGSALPSRRRSLFPDRQYSVDCNSAYWAGIVEGVFDAVAIMHRSECQDLRLSRILTHFSMAKDQVVVTVSPTTLSTYDMTWVCLRSLIQQVRQGESVESIIKLGFQCAEWLVRELADVQPCLGETFTPGLKWLGQNIQNPGPIGELQTAWNALRGRHFKAEQSHSVPIAKIVILASTNAMKLLTLTPFEQRQLRMRLAHGTNQLLIH